MRRRFAVLAGVGVLAAIGVALAFTVPRVVGREPARFEFRTLLQRHGQAVSASVFDGLVIYKSELGRFTIPTRCDTAIAHITRWTLPDGRVMTSDYARRDESGWLNDPIVGGLGAFAVQVSSTAPPTPASTYTTGTKRCDDRGVTSASAPEIHRATYEQSVCLSRCLVRLQYRWTFRPASIHLLARVQFHGHPGYLKEPEFGWNINGPAAPVTFAPLGDVSCQSFVGRDPRHATGRCSDPARLGVDFAGVRLRVDKTGLAELARAATAWPRAGDGGFEIEGTLRTEPFQRSEYIGWERRGASLLEKGWDGGINAWDAPALFRHAAPSTFSFSARLTRVRQASLLRRQTPRPRGRLAARHSRAAGAPPRALPRAAGDPSAGA